MINFNTPLLSLKNIFIIFSGRKFPDCQSARCCCAIMKSETQKRKNFIVLKIGTNKGKLSWKKGILSYVMFLRETERKIYYLNLTLLSESDLDIGCLTGTLYLFVKKISKVYFLK